MSTSSISSVGAADTLLVRDVDDRFGDYSEEASLAGSHITVKSL